MLNHRAYINVALDLQILYFDSGLKNIAKCYIRECNCIKYVHIRYNQKRFQGDLERIYMQTWIVFSLQINRKDLKETFTALSLLVNKIFPVWSPVK